MTSTPQSRPDGSETIDRAAPRQRGAAEPQNAPLDLRRAQALYEQGHTLTDIAALLGLSSSQLSKRLRQAGVAMRSRPRQAGRARSDLIRRLREQDGLTWAQIGAQFGITGSAACQDYLAHRAPKLAVGVPAPSGAASRPAPRSASAAAQSTTKGPRA